MRIASTQPGKPVRCRKMKPEYNIEKLCEAGKSGLLCKKSPNDVNQRNFFWL